MPLFPRSSRGARSRLVVVVFIAVALLAGGALTALRAPPAAAGTVDDQAFLTLINGVRASRGIAPLTVDANLTALAQDHSAWMAAGNGLVHTSSLSTGVTTRWARLGENIGFGSTVDVIWQAFLASPAHFANLTDARFDKVGIATVVTANGTKWTTHRFMQTGAAPAPAPAPPPPTAPPRVAPPPPTTVRRAPAPPVTAPPTTSAPVITEPPATEPPVTEPPPLVASPPNPAGVAYVLDALHVVG